MGEDTLQYNIPDGLDADSVQLKIERVWKNSQPDIRAILLQSGLSQEQSSQVALKEPFNLTESGGGTGAETIALVVSLAPLIKVMTPLLQPFFTNAAEVAKKIALDCWEITRKRLWESEKVALVKK